MKIQLTLLLNYAHHMAFTLIDLTRDIETNMPVFPGSGPVVLIQESSLPENSYNEIRLNLSTHTGTHIDCPFHLLEGGQDTTTIPAGSFYGPAMVIDCRSLNRDGIIEKQYLQHHENRIRSSDFILLLTGWERFWGLPEYYSGFPVMSEAAAQYLASFPLKGIGSDTGSFDPADSDTFPIHHILMASGLILVENLVNLEGLPESEFVFSCLPLRIKNGDGSPVRAVGITKDPSNKL